MVLWRRQRGQISRDPLGVHDRKKNSSGIRGKCNRCGSRCSLLAELITSDSLVKVQFNLAHLSV